MGSLNRNAERQLFDPIRNKWVEKTPEEMIRQQLILYLINHLRYPIHLISVEKELATLAARMKEPKLPKRRIDIAIFSQSHLKPLMIIECKASPLNEAFANQVIGYNAFIKAPYIALANDQEVKTGFFDPQQNHYRFEPGLPSFVSLTRSVPLRCLRRDPERPPAPQHS